MNIIVTGSSGYIGSCLISKLEKKYNILGIDKIKPKFKQKNFIKCDLKNFKKTKEIFKKFKPDIIFHLAGQSTIDGIKEKEKYITNNYTVTKNIVKIIKSLDIKHLLFSSTAAVYKQSNFLMSEKTTVKPNNIYGKTKLLCEKYIKNNIKNSRKYIIFRFFNVCSALVNPSCGELHNPETHLIPIVIMKYLNQMKIKIYGNNYRTKDGTCIRDYIHIKDIILAFEKGIDFLQKKKKSKIINLGTGKGYSVMEIIRETKKIVFPKNLNFEFHKKRKGDIDKLVCKNDLGKKILSWKPINSSLKKIITDEILWQMYLKKKKIYRKSIY
tara:strand:+ start:1464 stop:2441 length:978 start_codon:yes stop_codon:yes gene_type:complete